MTLLGLLVVREAGPAAGEATPDWQLRWEQTVEAARKEGAVTVYVVRYRDVVETFAKSYPDVTLATVSASTGGQLSPRLIAERRAGKYLADVFIAGIDTLVTTLVPAQALDPIRNALILPEVLDESRWWRGRHHYADREGLYGLMFEGSAGGDAIVSYNTQLVKPGDITSYRDLLNPRWKGKMVSNDPGVPGTASTGSWFFYRTPSLGPTFLTKLFSEMDVTVSRDERQILDWLAQGRFHLCLFCSDVEKAEKQGLPVGSLSVVKEGSYVSPRFGVVGLVNKAPHPNAAKVFINWLLSREGQIAFQKIVLEKFNRGVDSLRVDIPKTDVPQEFRRKEGVTYLLVDYRQAEDIKMVRGIIQETLGKRKTP